MIWQQPWAWVGVLAIAAPILIHLLGLGRSPRQRFPTLRFFDATRLAPTRRTQVHDPWLLLLRVAMFVAAVAALAQPLYRSGDRERAYAQSLARVVVLDTSASVQRAGALDSARRLAASLVVEADVGHVLETARPSLVLDGAIAWLGLQSQRRELVLLSDFQRGAIDTVALRRVPAETGVRLQRIADSARQFPIASEHHFGTRAVRAVVSRADSGFTTYTQVEWTSRALTDSAAWVSVRVLAGNTERDAVRAALDASHTVGANLVSLQDSAVARDRATSNAITIVTPESPQRASIVAAARTPREPWMFQAIAALRSNPVLQDIARAERLPVNRDSVVGLVVVYGADDQAAVWAAEAQVEGRSTLVLVARAPAQSVTMPALLAAARAVTAPPLTMAELEPEQLGIEVLTRLSREPATTLRGGVSGGLGASAERASDGRWLWLLVLVLLGAEALLRRRVHTRRRDSVTA